MLDDISRAPGEALNVLLRILNERKFGNDPIPLITAIATGNPSGDEYCHLWPAPFRLTIYTYTFLGFCVFLGVGVGWGGQVV